MSGEGGRGEEEVVVGERVSFSGRHVDKGSTVDVVSREVGRREGSRHCAEGFPKNRGEGREMEDGGGKGAN